jgi:hypothetical protein
MKITGEFNADELFKEITTTKDPLTSNHWHRGNDHDHHHGCDLQALHLEKMLSKWSHEASLKWLTFRK